MSRRWKARALLDLVLDTGSFESWDEPVDISGHPEEYRRTLEAAVERAGTDESVVTGRGTVRGRPVVVVVNEFAFLAGSIGRAAATRITSAVRRATAEGLPVLASTSSGGTRMQEGTPAFLQMVEISRALMDHRAAGLPYLVYLRHPTTGGVFASWGSLGHVTVAEPEALLGFLGTQSDKTNDALDTMLGLLGRPPITAERLATAQRSLEESYRAERIEPRAIAATVQAWDDLGETTDPRPRERSIVTAVDLPRIERFAAEIGKGSMIVSIAGDADRFDLGALGKLGKLVKLEVKQLFSY